MSRSGETVDELENVGLHSCFEQALEWLGDEAFDGLGSERFGELVSEASQMWKMISSGTLTSSRPIH